MTKNRLHIKKKNIIVSHAFFVAINGKCMKVDHAWLLTPPNYFCYVHQLMFACLICHYKTNILPCFNYGTNTTRPIKKLNASLDCIIICIKDNLKIWLNNKWLCPFFWAWAKVCDGWMNQTREKKGFFWWYDIVSFTSNWAFVGHQCSNRQSNLSSFIIFEVFCSLLLPFSNM